jgi:cytochrome c-type biogenesis protein CcmH
MHRCSRYARRARGGLILLAIAVLAAVALGVSAEPARAQVEMSQDANGTVGIRNPTERLLFSSLTCTCGTCPQWTLDKCTCGFAAERREELRAELAKGKSIVEIQAEYSKEYGMQALALPPNEGMSRLVWMGPLVALVAGAGLVGVMLRRWSRKGSQLGSSASQGPRMPPSSEKKSAGDKKPGDDGDDDDEPGDGGESGKKPGERDDYDDRLDQELKDLDDE